MNKNTYYLASQLMEQIEKAERLISHYEQMLKHAELLSIEIRQKGHKSDTDSKRMYAKYLQIDTYGNRKEVVDISASKLETEVFAEFLVDLSVEKLIKELISQSKQRFYDLEAEFRKLK